MTDVPRETGGTVIARLGWVVLMFAAFCVIVGWSTTWEVAGAISVGVLAGLIMGWLTRGS